MEFIIKSASLNMRDPRSDDYLDSISYKSSFYDPECFYEMPNATSIYFDLLNIYEVGYDNDIKF